MGEPWLGELEALRGVPRQDVGTVPRARVEPFADVLWPIVVDAWAALSASTPAAGVLADGARLDLRLALLRRLSELLTPALAELFAERRDPRAIEARLAGRGSRYVAPRAQYRRFVADLLDSRLAPLLTRYPVLGRLLVTAVRQWRDGTRELLERLERDRAALAAALGVPAGAKISAVATDQSDPHERGRRVMILHFDTGERVVYKPKDLRLEALYAQLVELVAVRLPDAALRAVRVLCAGAEYGYAEFIGSAEPDAPLSAPFLRNAGRLLALLHIAGATDCHHQNVIRSGDALVLIDAETLFEGHWLDISEPAPVLPGPRSLEASVLRVGLLPSWMPLPSGQTVDVSGLGASETALASLTGPAGRWTAVNTDDMAWAPPGPGDDLGAVGTDRRDALARHAEDVAAGFAEVYRHCLDPSLRDPLRVLLTSAHGLTRRVVLRSTRIYSEIQANACSPAAASSWFERALRLEQLSRAFVAREDWRDVSPLLAAEIACLEQLDIPRFQSRIGSPALLLDGRVVLDDVAAVDGLDAALTRLDRLSEDDLAWQVTLIRGALHAGAAEVRAPRTATEDRRLDPEAIARTVTGAAFDDADGHPAWLVATPVGDGRRLQLGVIGDGLYDGRAGVAAFLYACGERERARATLAPVLAALDAEHAPRSAYVRSLGLGLAGAGGLLRLFLFLEAHAPRDGAWSDYAAAIVHAVSPEAIRRSREVDLLAGPVGLAKPLAALLGRPGCEPAAGLLECIVEGALAAVDRRTGGWPNAAGVALTGLAHGAGGVVVALAEACLALGSLPALDAVLGGVGYERERYLSAGGWADLRGRSAPPRFMHAWCHGTVGIALARARLCELIPGHADVWARDLELAVEHALAEPLTEHDHLCCGNVGRIAVLAHVGRSTGRQDWVERARRLEADCLAAPGGWRTLTAGGRDAVPGLMTGLAGVGMHALFEGDSSWVEALLL